MPSTLRQWLSVDRAVLSMMRGTGLIAMRDLLLKPEHGGTGAALAQFQDMIALRGQTSHSCVVLKNAVTLCEFQRLWLIISMFFQVTCWRQTQIMWHSISLLIGCMCIVISITRQNISIFERRLRSRGDSGCFISFHCVDVNAVPPLFRSGLFVPVSDWWRSYGCSWLFFAPTVIFMAYNSNAVIRWRAQKLTFGIAIS